MKKLRAICATALLVLAFSLPALADDGVIGMGSKPPIPPPINLTNKSATMPDEAANNVVSYMAEAELYVVRGLVGLL